MMQLEVTNFNGEKFIEIDKIIINNQTYVFLSNTNKKLFFIRKLKVLEDKVYYSKLDNLKEYNLSLLYFVKKHKNFIVVNN